MDGPGRVDGWYTATSLADIIVYSVRQGSGKIWACREQFWRKRCSACMYSATIKPLLTMTVTMAVVVWKRRVRWKTAANTNILIKHMRKCTWIKEQEQEVIQLFASRQTGAKLSKERGGGNSKNLPPSQSPQRCQHSYFVCGAQKVALESRQRVWGLDAPAKCRIPFPLRK